MNTKKLMKAAAWAAAPKAMFAVKNPRKAALVKAAGWAAGRLRPAPKRHTGRNAALGLGAAALTIPLGLWVGRKLRGEESGTESR
jgi:hypothetical protein